MNESNNESEDSDEVNNNNTNAIDYSQFRFDVRERCIFYLNEQCRYSDSYCRHKHDPQEKLRYSQRPKKTMLAPLSFYKRM